MQCFSCLEFGHTKNANAEALLLNVTIVVLPTKCFHSIEHNSLYKKCPEYERQKEIKRIMAYENISYFDAKELVSKMYDAGIDEAPQAHESRSNFKSNITVGPQDFHRLRNIQSITMLLVLNKDAR
ncbi:hypothetical protein JTB14_026609 [Gonioctena quinquepunctata]|nr:hypothetical protein JTB14_026609 [Gonioctena quinquepunctata]